MMESERFDFRTAILRLSEFPVRKSERSLFANLEGIVDFMTPRDDASGFKMIAVARKDKQFGGVAAMLLPSVRRETCRDIRDRQPRLPSIEHFRSHCCTADSR